ncbi:mucin-5AC isoform X2 [Hyalella azteca]|uniref:Mucin-5AC isoform X2 n=1 Tax=Hyalella azteca TaxID=294128 RepID=A0A8B7NTI8_HYAAZ|nr:mucin-5AC isoform X2 [Hyalella azteca]
MLGSSKGMAGGERGGPSMLATLKVRVARLEAALRDKEAELSRLQSSTKVTAANELRIQAQTYYQEVVRLRNQLNISQHAAVPILHTQSDITSDDVGAAGSHSHNTAKHQKFLHERSELTSYKLSNMDSSPHSSFTADLPPSPQPPLREDEETLRQSVLSLHEENEKLREQVTTLVNTMRNSDQGMSNSSREVLERLLLKLEDKGFGSSTDGNTSTTQMKMAELRGKELEWERERSSLRELISTLQEDRCYYKDTASKKDAEHAAAGCTLMLHSHYALVRDEMARLRSEMLALQQQMMSLKNTTAGSSRAPVRPNQRLTPRVSGSASSSENNSSTGRRTQSTVRGGAPRPHVAVARSSASSSRSQTTSRSSKASSEPRELPPAMTTTSHGAAISKRDQQLSTSARLASIKVPAPRTPAARGGPVAVKKLLPANRRDAPTAVQGRSASTAPSKTRVAVTSSSQSASGSGRSTASSSTASSKTNSQKGTPLPSPTKVQVPIAKSRTIASNGYKSSNSVSSKTPKTKSSSSSSQSSRQSSKPNSTPSTPSRSLVTSPSKTKSILPLDNGGKSSPRICQQPSKTIAISEEDADVLVALLQPEPLEAGLNNGSIGAGEVVAELTRQRTMTLSWDSGGGGDTDDSWGATYRSRGVAPGQSSENSDLPAKDALPDPSDDVTQAKETNSSISHKTQSPAHERASAGNNYAVSSVDELKCLLQSHLHRQQKLNQLLEQEPVLVQTSPVRSLMTVKQMKNRKSHRRSPDGAEGNHNVLESSMIAESQCKSLSSPSHSAKALSSPSHSAKALSSPSHSAKALSSPSHSAKALSSPSHSAKALSSPSHSTKALSSQVKATRLPQSPLHRSASATSGSSAGTPKSPHAPSPTKALSTGSELVSRSTKLKKRKSSASRSGDSEMSVCSPGIVRQGTFNLDESEAFISKSHMGEAGENCELGEDGWLIDDEKDSGEILSATIAAHVSRMRQIQDLKK